MVSGQPPKDLYTKVNGDGTPYILFVRNDPRFLDRPDEHGFLRMFRREDLMSPFFINKKSEMIIY